MISSGRLISCDFFFSVMKRLLVCLSPDTMVKVMFLILPCITVLFNYAFIASHFNFREHSPIFESEVAPSDQSWCRNCISKATQILANKSRQLIWGLPTSVLHLKTDDQCIGLGKTPQISQPGAIVHPSALTPGSSSTLDDQKDRDGHLCWLSQKVFLMT